MAEAPTELDEYPHLSPAYRLHTELSHGCRNSRGDGTRTPEEELELTEHDAPASAPTSQCERRGSAIEAGEQAIRRSTRSPQDTRRNAELPRNVTPSPADGWYSADHHLDSPNGTTRKYSGKTGKKNQDDAKEPHNSMLTELYTVSWLVFFSFWGTLARLGIEAITLYPNTPFPSRVLWANLGGSFAMGFLSEDRRLFREEWGWTAPDASFSKHGKVKKTIPLFIGLATGFCGCFTSFSSFIRDAFLALTNALESPSPTTPYHANPTIASRNGGFSFLALMAVLIVHPAVSISALKAGAHFALLLHPITPVLPFRLTRCFLDPLGVVLAFGCWIGAVVISIVPPGDSTTRNDWRSRAALPLVFSPLGCLLRFYASKHLNTRIPSFPLGTFTVNIFGTMVLGMAWDLQHARTVGASSNVSCSVLQGVMEGFCGCLTTVSTWVLELQGLRRGHAWVYGLASLVVGLGFMVIIIGSMGWTIGFAKPACN